ncbi:MAG: hypothetical protein NZ929_06420 [Aigarchaeota archaeon]|nr:hypothetical protein [Aigarchaeota archaeon]MCX8192427.1 hypothetical protein [Nitrososphaeria archaeon]MDW7986633.1 hypothetical protein [Nitrososphaerota archaeon]
MKKKVVDFLKENGLNIEGDGVLEVLMKGSSLTEPQAETLLIEYASQINGKKIDTEVKASIRGVSKGAYATTKAQAMNNIKKSIYTILLLRYLRILSDTGLSRLLEAVEKLGRGDIEGGLELLQSIKLRDITE